MLRRGGKRLTRSPGQARSGSLGDDRAASTLVAAALVAVMLLVGLVLHDITGLNAARSQAQAAADAAAKAAGLELTPLFGVGTDPRRAAQDYAAHNGCRVAACEFGGNGRYLWVTVRAVRRVDHLILKSGGCEVAATARCYLDPDPP
jgi:streptogramin lyase